MGMAAAILMTGMTSCFTGVEGTSKISLSKKDIVATAPSAEELLLADIKPAPLGNWQSGRLFIVADGKFRLVAEISGIAPHEGDTLRYVGLGERQGADGGWTTTVRFATPGGNATYTIEKDSETARKTMTASDIPMLTDIETVASVRDRLKGKRLWTRTALWYDDSLQYKKGKKFAPVTVEDVTTGNAFFPMAVVFAGEGGSGRLLMSMGNGGNESRAFQKLFLLTDPREKYRHISDESWRAIMGETVHAGMTKEEVRLAIGNPSDVMTGHDYSRAMEIWTYGDGRRISFIDGLMQ